MKQLKRLILEEQGIQHAEEAMLLALIAVALVGAVVTLRNGISTTFDRASNCLAANAVSC